MVSAKTPWPSESVKDLGYEALCQRQSVVYVCDRGHDFEVVFAASAELPAGWPCRCGGSAGVAEPDPAGPELQRRMAQLRQRRSEADLEELLAERLALMRGTHKLRSGARR